MRARLLFFALPMLACSSKLEVPPPSDRPVPVADGESTSDRASGTPPGVKGGASGSPPEALAKSPRPRLQWKRYAALEADLASALELPPDQLCTELGSAACIRDVHLVPLGGHEPFSTGMLESAAEPLATTPTVVERVVLSACSARVELDRSEHKLFAFDLDARASADQAPLLAQTLFRRFHARDPEASELDALRELAVDELGEPLAADEYAKLACFLVGSLSEFLFF